MPKSRAKKTSRKASKSRKSNKSKLKMVLLLVGLAFLFTLAAEAVYLLLKHTQASKAYPVQVVAEFSGDSQACGAFRAWDIIAGPGWLAVTDQDNKRILFFDPKGNYLKEITAKEAGEPEFHEISRMSLDPKGDLYVMDTWNTLIRGFDPKGKQILKASLADKGFYGPRGLAWDNGDFAVADTGSHRLVKVSNEGAILFAWGQRGTGRMSFGNPAAVSVDDQGNFYVVDSDNNRVQVVDPQGHYLREIKVDYVPTAQALDLKNKLIYVSSNEGKFIKAFRLDGTYLGTLVDARNPTVSMEGVNGLSVDDNGDIIALRGSHVVVYHPGASTEHP